MSTVPACLVTDGWMWPGDRSRCASWSSTAMTRRPWPHACWHATRTAAPEVVRWYAQDGSGCKAAACGFRWRGTAGAGRVLRLIR